MRSALLPALCITLAACDVAPPLAAAPADPPPAPPAPAPADGPWLDVRGTSIVGFGLLRLVPPPGAAATFRIRYRETPDGYATTGDLQLFVLPAAAFAAKDRAYAGEFLAFVRTPDHAEVGADGALALETTLTAAAETTVLVCYGPWTAPDAGRPAGDVPTFSLDVTSDAGAHEWLESEAGEMITTNWTRRPEVQRGASAPDPVGGAPVWIEVRPMILYDARLARSSAEPGAPPELAADAETARSLREEIAALAKRGDAKLLADRTERLADLEAHLARADRRLVLTPALAEKFRRVPIRWR